MKTYSQLLNNSLVSSSADTYLSGCQYLGAALVAPTQSHIKFLMFGFGISLLLGGISEPSTAQLNIGGGFNCGAGGCSGGIGFGGGFGGGVGSAGGFGPGTYNDVRFAEATNRIFGYLEGAFGSLVMVAAGLGTIISSAFGQYRAAMGLLVVAVGAFILRSLVSTFFNDVNIG